MNQKFISKSNYVLRNVLNSENHLEILQDLIESFLQITIQKITLNPYLEIHSKYLPSKENFGIADVRIVLSNGEELNIGIQILDGYYLQRKMLLYYSQIHCHQMSFQKRQKIVKTITLNFLNVSYFTHQNYHTMLQIPCKETTKREKVELHILELPKFSKPSQEIISKKEAWMIYFCCHPSKLLDKVLKDFPMVKKLDTCLDQYWLAETME